MEVSLEIEKPGAEDLQEIKQLLQQNKLPVEDIADLSHFFIAKKGKKIAGVIGLEVYNQYGLLRSMVTDANYRKYSIASSLVDKLFQYAVELGLKEMYLLTETAEQYFQKKGFHTIERDNAPKAIKQTKEFSHLCPSSAVVMKKIV